MPPHFVQGAWIGTGSAVVATVPHVEQNQLRLRMRSSGRTISSGGPRRSITSRSVFMAQDVGEITGDCHRPSRLSRRGEARHHRRQALFTPKRSGGAAGKSRAPVSRLNIEPQLADITQA
jgi:hypothetical protein